MKMEDKKLKITLVGSITQVTKMLKAAKTIKDLFDEEVEIHIPPDALKRRKMDIISDWFNYIDDSHLVVAFKKDDDTFGDGTTYEIAFAKMMRIPVLTWKD